jgi:hypothetical protein
MSGYFERQRRAPSQPGPTAQVPRKTAENPKSRAEGPTYVHGVFSSPQDMAARAWGGLSALTCFCGRAARSGPLAQAGMNRAFGAEDSELTKPQPTAFRAGR